jgi:multiple sugar transport system permease protein
MAEIARRRDLSFGAGRRIGHVLDGERVFGYVMVAPAIAYILVLVAYPFAIAIWFTMSNATVAQPIADFTGLTNLRGVLDDDIFKRALFNTFIFTVSSQILQMVFGTILAFLLLKKFRGRRIARALVMLPFTIPVAIGAMAWTWMLNPTYSVINWIGEHAGLFTQGPNWLGEEIPAMISIILVNVWRNLPFSAIVLTAGISSVPSEILEAADLDGAGWWVRWRRIIAPIIAPVLYIALLFSLVFTATDMTVVWLMTRGNPVNSTHVIASYAFQTGVVAGSLGRGATMSLFLFPVLMIAAILFLRNIKSRSVD